jgi:superfamily II DNA/RNA helicase
MSKVQKKVYGNIIRGEIATINQGGSGSKTRLLNIVMQLRKAANHPYLFDGVEDRSLDPYGEHLVENCGKMVVLDKLLAKLFKQDSRVLIFSQMTRCLDILEDYCMMRGHKFCRIDGNTSTADREDQMQEYNAPGSEKFVFLLSTRAGGLGINLHTADIVVLYDSDWNPQMDLQAQDRAHRIGQTKQVRVYRFLTEDSIEVKIIQRAETKLRLDALVVQQGRLTTSNKISKDEMMEMIRYGADMVFRNTEGSITDEDIDILLAKCETKTAEMNEKLQKHAGGMMEFALDGGSEFSLLNAPATSAEKAAEKKAEELAALIASNNSIGKRERKRSNYNEASFYHGENGRMQQVRSSLLPQPRPMPRTQPYQFFDTARLEALYKKEKWFFDRYQWDENPPRLRGLTDAEEEERTALLAAGFPTWNHKEKQALVRACVKYGRTAVAQICKYMTTKAPEEVRAYLKVFLARYTELPNHGRVTSALRTGEKLLKKKKQCTIELNNLISSVMSGDADGDASSSSSSSASSSATTAAAAAAAPSTSAAAAAAPSTSAAESKTPPTPPPTPLVSKAALTLPALEKRLPLKYRQSDKDRGYSAYEDCALLLYTYQHGYGNWNAVRKAVLASPYLVLNYYVRTRMAYEYGRRIDTLLRVFKQGLPSFPKAKKKTKKTKKNGDGDGDDDGDDSSVASMDDDDGKRSPTPTSMMMDDDDDNDSVSSSEPARKRQRKK